MATYRDALPQLGGDIFLTDGGIETTMIFHRGLELPHFATFVLMEQESGLEALRDYYRSYLDIAREAGFGFVLETPTWRANADWGHRLGYDKSRLAAVNRKAVEMLDGLRNEYADATAPIVISGNLGPRGDGYVADNRMTAADAERYHDQQISAFVGTTADMVCAVTLTYVEEAIGIVNSARRHGMPAAIGFTTETDGRLPSGQPLGDAVAEVDATTDSAAAYFMVNCAHTEHFADALEPDESWTKRIRAVRANASRMSHAELDQAEELDDGDPAEFGQLCQGLRRRFPHISVLGGCCGTDHRHIGEVRAALRAA